MSVAIRPCTAFPTGTAGRGSTTVSGPDQVPARRIMITTQEWPEDPRHGSSS